jgi:hypothetical protein
VQVGADATDLSPSRATSARGEVSQRTRRDSEPSLVVSRTATGSRITNRFPQ